MKQLISSGIACACLLTMPQLIQAQVSGRLVNENQQSIEAATVVLQTIDSTYVATSLSDSTGTFCFDVQPNHYRLLISHLLYHPRQVEITGTDAGILTLIPQTHALEGVTVRGERPLVKAEGGKLVYDIPQLTRNKLVNNAYECLTKLPGVMEQDGALTLAGAGSLTLLLNGRPSTLTAEQVTALLKSTPASRVQQAEVMYTTPPQYHVRGASVNIVLKGYKEGENEGWQGELNGAYTYQYDHNAEGGITLTHLTPKTGIDLMYTADYKQSRSELGFIAPQRVNEQTYDVRQLTRNGGQRTKHHVRTGIHYKFAPQTQLSLAYTGAFTPHPKTYSLTTGTVSSGATRNTGQTQLHNISLAFESNIGLKAGADYTHYKDNGMQALQDNDSQGNTLDFRTDSRQLIDRYKLYADQSHTLSHGWKLNYGASITAVANRNTQRYDLPSMAGKNTTSNIDEQTYDAYAGVDKRFNPHLSFNASATVEYYRMENYRKWAVYPTLQVTYTASPAHIVQGSFRSDKTYPPYWTLSGSTTYLNNYTEIAGNPFLRPYTDYTASLTYILRSKYVFSLSYQHQPDYFQQTVYLASDRLAAIYNTRNWDFNRRLMLTAVIPFRAGTWLDSRLTLIGMRQHAKASDYFDAPFDKRRWTALAILDNTFTLHKNLQAEVNAFVQSRAIQGSYDILALWKADAALRYTFAHGKARLRLKATDLFDTLNPKTRIRNGAQHLDMDLKSFNRSLQVSLSYSFGGYKQKKVDEVDTSRFGQ